jgi:flagellar motor switch protein FliN/FliY
MKEKQDMSFKALNEVPLKISAVLGETTMTVEEVLKFSQGTIIELGKKIGEPVDIYVNEKIIAKGEIVIVGEKIGITLTEIAR